MVVARRPLLLLVSSTSLFPILTPAQDVRGLPRRLARLVESRLRRYESIQGQLLKNSWPWLKPRLRRRPILVQLPPTNERRDITDADSYAVYRSFVLEQRPIRVDSAVRLVIARDAVTYDRCLPSGGPMATEWRPVLESYKVENIGRRRILPNQDLGRPYVLVDVRAIHELFKPPAGNLENGWSRYYELYPDSGGYIQLSTVGFDRSKTRALLYASHHCGSLCGGGGYELLEKRDGRWARANLKDAMSCAWAS